ncbi:ftsk protein [Holzapfeliella floricola DSM 23037 = JCM 16512]|uniref:Ftsk protein n=2 Tax=Holzapfeliella TaxID=2767883 RepID=A0A0R2DJF9_9LACO|nr:ftsk protein [Holzapfeliella floricola DSM 23037 = JCM 16512]
MRDLLLSFITNNNLFKEDFEVVQWKDGDNNIQKEKRYYVSSSAEFKYFISNSKIIVYAIKNADIYTATQTKLDEALSALFGLELSYKKDTPSYCEYHFDRVSPERKVVKNNERIINKTVEYDLGYGVSYRPDKVPHVLISGGTGSGKSVFIEFLIIEFLKRKADIFICDPKNSDLSQLEFYLGSDKVASSLNQIAKVSRLVVEEMESRYQAMKENFEYGSNYITHGYSECWLIFDEMGAFQGNATDKKSKEVVNEVMGYIRQIILKGRAAGVFVLVASQQMNANTLNTDLRDNLGLRIALGANSGEGYRMVFGSATPDNIPVIEEKGAGLLFMQGSGQDKAQYYEAPFIDRDQFDFIEELTKYID